MKSQSGPAELAHSELLYEQLRQKIIEFNAPFFATEARQTLAIAKHDDDGNLVAGIAGKTFGLWLFIDYLWVDDHARGQGLGAALMQEVEFCAYQRGCLYVLLDTLDFQARPFYEKLGYQVQFVQQQYPRQGQRFYLTKTLVYEG